MTQMVKYLNAMQKTWVWPLGWEEPLKKGVATHPSILAWRISWTEEPGRLQSMESQRIGYNWATNIFTFDRKNRIHISLQYPRINTKLDHIYSHKININNLKEFKSQNILNNHNGIKLKTNNRKRIESEKSWELTTYFKKTNKIHGLKRKTQEKIHCIKWKLKYDT